MRSFLPLLLLTGCPYLWGPPGFVDTGRRSDPNPDTGELRESGEVPVDTDPRSTDRTDETPIVETGTPPEETGDPTETGVPLPEPPEVERFEIALAYDEIRLTFDVSDPDGDVAAVDVERDGLLLGRFTLGVDTTWDGSTGTLLLPHVPVCVDSTSNFTIVAVDARSRTSAPSAAALQIFGGEVPADGVLLSVSPSTVLCSPIGQVADKVEWPLEWQADGRFTVYLDQLPGRDFDLKLTGAAIDLTSDDSLIPDQLTADFFTLDTYTLALEPDGGGAPVDSYVLVFSL